MAGHSKWAQIKHRKAVEDAKKSRLFSVLAQTIALEARQAGGDRNAPGLRQAIEKARAANLPAENIERAIQSGFKKIGGGEEVLYEAYGPGGAALLIECLTDNKNRTSQEIKRLLLEHQANLATPGAAFWAFEKKGGGFEIKNPLALDQAFRERLNQLIAALRAHPDVKNVFTNAVNL